MVLFLIGLGLGSKEDITLKGLNAIKKSCKVYLEHYTSILCATTFNESNNNFDHNINNNNTADDMLTNYSHVKQELEKFYGLEDRGIEIQLADRQMVEERAHETILDIKYCTQNNHTSFLVVGDPFCATTHTDLLLRAAKQYSIEVKVIHNASIMNCVSCCGLQLYKFGQTVSIPFWTAKWKPTSFYDKIVVNFKNGMHTLCLLDIKMKEVSEENMIAGQWNIFEQPRFMDIHSCISQLLEIECSRIKKYKERISVEEKELKNENETEIILETKPFLTLPDMKCIGLARIGHESQIIAYGTLPQLQTFDFGPPLHSFVIPGDIHFIESDVLQLYNIDIIADTNTNAMNVNFSGVWELESSMNLNEYLLSEGWNDNQREIAIKTGEKHVIEHDSNTNEFSVQFLSCSLNKNEISDDIELYSYSFVINGEIEISFVDNHDVKYKSIAKWKDERSIVQTMNTGNMVYILNRSLEKNQMIVHLLNNKGNSVTKYFKKKNKNMIQKLL